MALSVNGGPLSFEADIQMGQFMQKLNEIERGIHGVTQASEKEMKAVDSLVQKATGALAAYASFTTASSFISDIVRVRSEFQNLEVAFKVMLGSKAEADKLMAEVAQFAATTPFELGEIASATKSLLAFGIAAKDIKPTLTALGDVAAGVGMPVKELADIYGKAKTQGRLFAEDINQLTGRGIPIIQELAKQFGVTEDKVKGLVESGKVGFPQIEQAFVSLTSAGGRFAGMMSEMSKTIGGQISNLADSWSRMLNEMGQANEGTISGAIAVASKLVENYETVLDILKLLVATYGAYKAAVITTTAVQAIATNVTKGYTIAETLRYRAMLLSEKAMKLLNLTMLSNPAVAIATGIAALAAALLIFRKNTNDALEVQRKFNEMQARADELVRSEKDNLENLLEIARDETKSKVEREGAMRRINAISPEYLGNLTLEKLKTEEGTTAINEYIKALDRKSKAQAADEAKRSIDKQIIDAGLQRDSDLNARSAAYTKPEDVAAFRQRDPVSRKIEQDFKDTKKRLEDQKKTINELIKSNLAEELGAEGKKQEAKKRTVDVIDEEIKAEKEKQRTTAENSKEWNKYQQKINALEAEKLRITGATKSQIKAAQAEENKSIALAEKRLDLLKEIEAIQKGAELTGMGKEANVVAGINEKYDALIEKVGEYQKSVNDWNKKNPKNQVRGIGQEEINKINAARQLEISNQLMKEDVAAYEKSLKEKSDLYKQYQDTVKEVGKQDADKLYEGEKLAFDNYLDYLKYEIGKIGTKISLGVDLNLADEGKLKLLTQELKNVTKEQADQQIADTKRVMVATLNAAEQRKIIEANYLKEVEILRKTYAGKDLADRERVLKEALDKDLIALGQHLGEQTELYRKMNADVYNLANSRINNEIQLLEKQLKEIEGKDPGLAKAIKKAIEEWKKLQRQMNGTEDVLEALGEGSGKLAAAFSDLAGAFAGIDEGLSQSLNTIGDLIGGFNKATQAYKQFKDGIEKGGIEGTMGAIAGGIGMVGAAFSVSATLMSSLAKLQDKRSEQIKEEKQRQVDVLAGEMEINELYRQRAREQVLINKLRLEGIAAEMRLLEEQRKTNESDVARTLEALSKEFRKDYSSLVDQNMLLPNGQTYFEAMSLAGKTFEELEKLAAMNLLNDRSMQLFETLKKLKEEGVDIEQARQEAIRREQETLTATNADSIADSIIEGFKKGYRSAKDFADNFGEMMQAAVLNALKYNALEAPLNAFYEQFAADAKSGGALTKDEIANLQQIYNAMITDAAKQFEELQKVTGVSFKGGSSSINSLQGAIRGMTEETAELLAGQFAGQRLATLELVKIGQQNLAIQNRIQNNTGVSAQKLTELMDKLNRITNGAEKLNVKI